MHCSLSNSITSATSAPTSPDTNAREHVHRRPPSPPHYEQLETARDGGGGSEKQPTVHDAARNDDDDDNDNDGGEGDSDGGEQQHHLPCDVANARSEMKRCIASVEAASMCVAAGFSDCVCIISHQRSILACLSSRLCMESWWRAVTAPAGCSTHPTATPANNSSNSNGSNSNGSNSNNGNNGNGGGSITDEVPISPGGGGGPHLFDPGESNNGMSVSYEWPVRILHAQDAVQGRESIRNKLASFVKAKVAQKEQQQQQHGEDPNHNAAFGGAVRSTVVGLDYSDFGREEGGGGAGMLNALQAIESTVTRVALPRYIARLDSFADDDAPGWEISNIKGHVLPGDGVFGQELVHVSPDTSGISGIYCLAAPPAFNEPGSELMLTDPRRDLPQNFPLPPHTGSLGGGDNNPFFWDFKAGGVVLFPGDVPRMVTANFLVGDVVYISFDLKRKSNDENECAAAGAEVGAVKGTSGANVGKGADTGGAGTEHEIVITPSAGMHINASPPNSPSGTRHVLKVLPMHAPDMSELYAIRRKAASKVDAANIDVLSNVEDTTRWGTPIGLMHFKFKPGAGLPVAPAPADDHDHDHVAMQTQQLNDALVQDATKLAELYRRKQKFAVFQSPNSVNLFTLSNGQYSAVETLKPFVKTAILAYTSATPDCSTLEGSASSASSCRKQTAQWQNWASEIMVANGYNNNRNSNVKNSRKETKKQTKAAAGIYKVTSSWVNIAGKVERSINQIAHNHLVYKTAVTGVYYATSGWANASQATAIQLIRPCSLESKIGPSMLSIKPKAGSMLLFPSYILHAADIHLGDQKRVSFAFNAAA